MFLKILASLLFFILLFKLGNLIYSPILASNNIVFDIGIKKILIYPNNPSLWFFIQKTFIYAYIFNSICLSIVFFNISNSLKLNSYILHKLSKTNKFISSQSDKLRLYVGTNIETASPIYLEESGLYQNILVTGTIGTGKTSSAMYPFTKQLIEYESNNPFKKIGMLILDVKGNYCSKILEYAKDANRFDDIIVISLDGKYKYNPLNKPNLKASVLANQLKSILLLFSPNNSESYWLDKAEEVLTESIKLCRLYNNGYVTFKELHNLITQENYYIEKVGILRKKFLDNMLSKEDSYDLLSCINFFSKEFFSLDSRNLNILKSEITRITNCFVNDYTVQNIFSPEYSKLNFNGFSDVLSHGKIVVLKMNINEYRNLSKIIAAYLKIDFQTEVMRQLSYNTIPTRITAFISDEYSEYVTLNDANFFSQSREAKCINIISTQSYNSLLNTLNNQYAVKVIVQNLVNKLWFRTDDMFTIEDAQKQLRKSRKRAIFKNSL